MGIPSVRIVIANLKCSNHVPITGCSLARLIIEILVIPAQLVAQLLPGSVQLLPVSSAHSLVAPADDLLNWSASSLALNALTPPISESV